MNERIKEFARQATSYADSLDVADKKIYQEIRDREFAELIIKEAAWVASEKQNAYNSDLEFDILNYFEVE
jgi:hypothetical protein